MKILIDNGHGRETPGKRSPDGRLLEYAYTRGIARRIVSALTTQGHDAELLVPEQEDISLPERCRRVNDWCLRLGKDNVILISIHINAAGHGDRWMNATPAAGAPTPPEETPGQTPSPPPCTNPPSSTFPECAFGQITPTATPT